ncbi:LRR receptor-like serine threonine-protein kinase [Seminavis robusta]|uniref:LRR receptor-like serine threonine-protein kinase n=1 Tax=Seminavis robusta TaxID=568900 RepID=A0A9N8EL31_9STRA|nr:LRR receptor-like serine threonine-protein kinase [Seminavis robusta]|eukprot:Sro1369_g266910.1 LRR receptor-like serine threonine-protein kinase (563) ;mRNA; r:11227-13012
MEPNKEAPKRDSSEELEKLPDRSLRDSTHGTTETEVPVGASANVTELVMESHLDVDASTQKLVSMVAERPDIWLKGEGSKKDPRDSQDNREFEADHVKIAIEGGDEGDTLETPPLLLTRANIVARDVQPGAQAVAGPGRDTGTPNDDEVPSSGESPGGSPDQPIVVDEESLGVVNGFVVEDEPPESTIPQRELIEGTILREESGQRSRKKSWAALMCLFSCVIAATMTALLLPRQSKTNDPDEASAPFDEGMPTVYPPYQDGLPLALVKQISAVSSPYYMANIWMLQDPHLETYTEKQKAQRLHLVALFYFANGHNWTRTDHWLQYDVSECDWYSSSDFEPTCNEEGSFVNLNMSSNNLRGDLTGIHDHMLEMQVYDLSNNSLWGNPPNIGTSPAIEVMDVSNNDFTGFQKFNGGFVAFGLRVLRHDGNRFSGGASSGLFYLLVPALEWFNNSLNDYDGELPWALTNCKNLTHYSSKCDHVGSIPPEYGSLTKLQEFDIESNSRMIGAIPSELGLWTSLTSLNIAGTGITGTIPEALCSRALAGDLNIFANCSLVECCGVEE